MTERRPLQKLARLYGIQPAYYDVEDRLCEASQEALFRALRTLGAPLDRLEDAAGALRQRRQELARRVVEPVNVAWNGRTVIPLRLPADEAAGEFTCRVIRDDEALFNSPESDSSVPDTRSVRDTGLQQWTGDLRELPTVGRRTVEGVDYLTKRLTLPLPLPWGYHQLVLELPGGTVDTLLIAAPQRGYDPFAESGDSGSSGRQRVWGAFLPVYALHRDQSWGAGDFSDLEALMEWVGEQGGSFVATLPLLATLWEISNDPSPYSPASRLFWNEFYLDATRIPELDESSEARDLLNSSEVQREIEALRSEPLVKYHQQMALKRRIVQALTKTFFTGSSNRRAEFDRFRREHPEIERYARFRAAGEKQGHPWPEWPERMRDGTIEPGDYDESVYQYHLYAQWQVQQQLHDLAEKTRHTNSLWYLDFPLGVSRFGYDVWRDRELFALDMSGGSPPDTFFTKGQNWGFPPLHPERLREQGYRYVRGALRRHLRYARLLRIDHVMSLYRLYWIPEGLESADGVYVRYPVEEMFALLTLESHRHKAEIVGENLGTVPEAVNSAMRRHGIHETYVLQYDLDPSGSGADPPANNPPAESVASMNTHDMPPFAAFWRGLDIDDRVDLGLLGNDDAPNEYDLRAHLRQRLVGFLQRERLLSDDTSKSQDVLEASLAWLASSEAEVVLVNLEDLWGETRPQNTPGTFTERCNWRQKTRYTLEEIRKLPSVQRALCAVNDYRQRNRNV